VARYPILAGIGLVAARALSSTSTLNEVSATGLGAVLAGILLVAAAAGPRVSQERSDHRTPVRSESALAGEDFL
jgi:hypothetical protein